MSDLLVTLRSGGESRLKEARVREFKERLRGGLIRPEDSGYDEARRVYNAMHDRRPAMIVQAAEAGDVIAAVRFAAEHDLLLAVRGDGARPRTDKRGLCRSGAPPASPLFRRRPFSFRSTGPAIL